MLDPEAVTCWWCQQPTDRPVDLDDGNKVCQPCFVVIAEISEEAMYRVIGRGFCLEDGRVDPRVTPEHP